jgi:glycosyltransferase involved in cell wall biosynthesis
MTAPAPSPPLVDVGIPVFRRTRYVAEAIESVLAQTFSDWRIVVSENGPGGAAVEEAVSRYLDDPRISYVATGSEVSIAANWNGIVERCSGRYFTLLHDDDRWHPEWLERRVEFLEAHPECGFVFSPAVIVAEDGSTIVRLRGEFAEGVVGREALTRRLLLNNVVPVSAWLGRRSAIDEVGARYRELFFCDWELWLRLAAHAPTGFLDVHDNDYRKHAQQTTWTSALTPAELQRMYDDFDRIVAAELPGLRLGRRQRARGRATLFLSTAVDAFEGGARHTAFGFYRAAIRRYPPLALDTRSLALLAAAPFGRAGSRALRRLRWAIQRRALTPHLRSRMGWRAERSVPPSRRPP